MPRALLRGQPGLDPDDRVGVRLDDDCYAAPIACDGSREDDTGPTDYWPSFTIWLRVRAGFDDTGIPLFTWKNLGSAPARSYVTRDEWDPEAGVTIITADLVIGNPGVDVIPETAMLTGDDGTRWKVTGAKTYPDRAELRLRRIWWEAPPSNAATGFGVGVYGTGPYGE